MGCPWMGQPCPSLSDLHHQTAQHLHGLPGSAGVCKRVGDAHWSGCSCCALLGKEEHPKYLFKPHPGETGSNFLGVFHSAVAAGLSQSMTDVR